jgi:O-antigen/teichoic acid export membrane protein
MERTRKDIVGRIALHTASNAVLRLAIALLGFISLPVMVRSLGAEGNGLLLLAGTVMGYFTLMGLSLPTSVTKFSSEFYAAGEDKSVHQVINTAFYFYAGVGAFSSLLVALFVWLNGLSFFEISADHMASARQLMYLAGAWALVAWPAGVFSNALIGLHRSAENNVAVGLGALISSVSAIAVALKGGGVTDVFLAQGLGSVLSWILQYRLLRTHLPGWGLTKNIFSQDMFRRMFRFSIWLLLPQIGALLMYQTDKLILALLLPVSALTIYQVVITPYQQLKSIQGVFTSALFPAISSLGSLKDGKAMQLVDKSNIYVCMITGVVGMMGIILAEPFIRIWMGDSFVSYAWIAQMMCAFLMLQTSNGAHYAAFVALGKLRNLGFISIFVALLNVPLGVIATLHYGVAGVLFATVFAGALSILLQYIFLYPPLGLSWRDHWSGLIKGQAIFWGLGLLLIPLWKPLQSIDSLAMWLGAAASIGGVFTFVGWMAIMKPEHKDHVLTLWPMRLFRRTGKPMP